MNENLTLQAKLTLDKKNFDNNLKAAGASVGQQTKKMETEVNKVSRSVRNLKAAFAGIVTAAAIKKTFDTVYQSLDRLDIINDLSMQLGVSATRLQEWQYAADRTGSSSDAVVEGLKKLNVQLGLAQRGTGNARREFERYGISIKDTQGNFKSLETVFQEVIRKAGEMGNESERSAFLVGVLGKAAGPELSNFMAQGSRAIDDQIERARRLGLIYSEDVVQGAGEAKDKLDDLKQFIEVKLTTVIGNNSETIAKWADDWIEALDIVLQKAGEFSRWFQDRRVKDLEEFIRVKEEQFKSYRDRPSFLQFDSDEVRAQKLVQMDSEIKALKAELAEKRREIEVRDAPRPERPPRSETGNAVLGGGSEDEDAAKKATRAAEEEKRRIEELEKKKLEIRKRYASAAELSVIKYFEEAREIEETYADDAVNRQKYLQEALRKNQEENNKRLLAEREEIQELLESGNKAALEIRGYSDPKGVELTQQYERINQLKLAAINHYQTLLDIGNITPETWAELMNQLEENTDKAYAVIEERYTEKIPTMMETLKEMSGDFGMVFSSALEDAVVNGGKLGDIIDGLIKDIIRLTFRAMILKPLMDGLFGGEGGGIIGGAISSIFGKAGGGTIQPGKATLVGERGPELIVPSAPAQVLNNHMVRQMGGGGATKVEIINRGTPQRATASNVRMDPSGAVVQIIMEDLQRGGPLAQGMSNMYGLRRQVR